MSGSNWFGDLQLAYKYIVVFCSLLVLVFLAGIVKVLIDRRKLKKIVKKEELEAGPKEDQVELNQREKDEGDLFGIRAIEAGFYAGVAQSRPVSRAGSVSGTPAMSSSTLVGGGANSPLMKGHSANNSVLSLNLGHNDQQKTRPPTKLSPSEAELTGRHGAVDMSLQVPPSPGLPRGSPSPTGSDSGDEYVTLRANPQRPHDFHPQHYSPAPTIPMPDALQVTYHDVQGATKSQPASFNSSSPTPPPPGNPPATRLPTLPAVALRNESRSPSPEFSYPPRAKATTEPAQLAPVPTLQPQALAPAHKRDASDASSMYSQKRMSTFDAYEAFQKNDRSVSAASNDTYNYGFSTDESRGTSMVMTVDNNHPESSSHLAPPNSQDSRLSEFYEAYYRNSQIGAVQVVEAKRTVGRHSTIVEMDTPLASPMFAKSMQHPPGAAF